MAKVKVTESCGNVFEDLGFDKAEAQVLQMRADILIRLEKHLKATHWTQREVAEHLRITQPRVSKLMKGAWQDFSLDMLMTLAHRAGLRTRLTVGPDSRRKVA